MNVIFLREYENEYWNQWINVCEVREKRLNLHKYVFLYVYKYIIRIIIHYILIGFWSQKGLFVRVCVCACCSWCVLVQKNAII